MTAATQPRLSAVELKNKIQADLLAERNSLGDAEFDHRRQQWLANSNDPLAVMWRETSDVWPAGHTPSDRNGERIARAT